MYRVYRLFMFSICEPTLFFFAHASSPHLRSHPRGHFVPIIPSLPSFASLPACRHDSRHPVGVSSPPLPRRLCGHPKTASPRPRLISSSFFLFFCFPGRSWRVPNSAILYGVFGSEDGSSWPGNKKAKCPFAPRKSEAYGGGFEA